MFPESTGSNRNNGIAWLILPWIVPAILIKIFIFPDFQKLGFIHIPDDVFTIYWNAEHVKNALNFHTGLYHTNAILAPDGISLWGHALTLIIGVFNWVLDDAVVSINLVAYLHLVVFSAGIFKLTAFWITSPLYRLIIALVAVFNGYMLAKSGIHINLILLGLVPWNLYMFLCSFDGNAGLKKPRLLMLSLLLLGVNVAFDYYAIIYTISFMFLWYVYVRFLSKRLATMTWKKWAVVFFVFVLTHVISRLLWINGLDKKGGIWSAADIRSFFIPGHFGKWLYSHQVFGNSPISENFVYAGLSLILLLLICCFLFRKILGGNHSSTLWLFMLLAYFCITFPVIKWEGRNLFYLPTSFTHYIPVLDQFRAPGRMFEMFLIASLVFVFAVIEGIQWKNAWVQIGVITVFVSGFIFEHAVQSKQFLSRESLSPSSADMRYLQGKTTLTLPFGVRDGFRMLGNYQPTDGLLMGVPNIKLCSGYISRIPDAVWKNLSQKTLIRLTVDMSDSKSKAEKSPLQWAASVNESGVDAVRISEKAASSNGEIMHGAALLARDFKWRYYTESGYIYLLK